MPNTYLVYGVVSGSTMTVEIEANTPEEAQEKFWDKNEASPSICYHCTKEIEIGEVSEAIVTDSDGNELINETYSKRLLKKIKKLEEENVKLREIGLRHLPEYCDCSSCDTKNNEELCIYCQDEVLLKNKE